MDLAQTVDSVTTGPVRWILALVGIYEPLERGIFFGLVAILYLFWFRPLISFTAEGDPLPWSYYYPDPPSTTLPWWIIAFLTFLVTLLFI